MQLQVNWIATIGAIFVVVLIAIAVIKIYRQGVAAIWAIDVSVF